MNTPILFLLFNRPDKAKIVFERIKEAQPNKLFIAADGPRSGKEGEANLCEKTRKVVLDAIDWPCKVEMLFQEQNLGCKVAVSDAISWFFTHVESGLILEDDCLPDPSFFHFCEELLETYKNDERVMMISGNNFQPIQRGAASYHFARHVHIWGWATWRRAWAHYDLSMKKWPAFRDSKQLDSFLPQSIVRRRKTQFQRAFNGDVSTWDIQWVFACWEASGVSVVPNMNLVTNIDSGGTHMKIYDPCILRPTHRVIFPLVHPREVVPDLDADVYTQRYVVLRNGKRTLVLIARYLWKTLTTQPSNLWGDIVKIFNSLVAELQQRTR